jgi:hypothetical protein
MSTSDVIRERREGRLPLSAPLPAPDSATAVAELGEGLQGRGQSPLSCAANHALPVVPRTSVSIRVATLSDVPFIDELQKAHSKMVGFMPRGQLQGYIEGGMRVGCGRAFPRSLSPRRRGAESRGK